MNHINILKRAFNITVNYRALWIFGMLLALTTGTQSFNSGGSTGSSSASTNNTHPQFNPQHPFSGFPQWSISPAITSILIGVAIALACLVLVLIVVGTFARYISETALIRMVDGHEKTGEKLTIWQGFRLGWSHIAWKMFLMDLLVGLGFLIVLLVLLALAALPLLVWLTQNTPLHVLGTIVSVGLILLVVFAAIVAGLGISLIVLFARRALAIEDLGIRASLRRGYEMVRQHLGDAVMMGIMMFGVGLLWVIVTIPAILAIIIAAAIVAGLPALLAGAIVGIFAHGVTPWIVAAFVGAPIFLIVVIIPGALIGGWQKVFSSSAWTLTYRETLALEQVKANGELPAPAGAPMG